MTGRRSSFVAAIGWATVSVVLGHELVYRLYAPDDVVRARLLGATGHVWAGLAETTLVVAAITGIAGSLVGSRRWATTHVRFGILALIQCAVFLAIELGERIGSAGPLGMDALAAMVVLGLAIQLVLAVVGSVLSRYVARVALAAQRVDVVGHPAQTRIGPIRWSRVGHRTARARPRAPPDRHPRDDRAIPDPARMVRELPKGTHPCHTALSPPLRPQLRCSC
jgi:hypothetical protein